MDEEEGTGSEGGEGSLVSMKIGWLASSASCLSAASRFSGITLQSLLLLWFPPELLLLLF